MSLRHTFNTAAMLIVMAIVPPLHAGSYEFVSFEFPPLEYAAGDDKAAGIAVEIVTRAMHSLGHEVYIRIYPWTRALAMVRAGSADAIFTAYKNAERELYLDFSSQVLIPQVVYFYKNRDSDVEFDGNLESVHQKSIGVVSTISYGLKFDQAKPGLIIDKAHKLEHNFLKLLLHRVDLVPSNSYVADYTLRRMRLSDKIVRLPNKIESVPSYLAFSKKHDLKTLRDQFDRQLAMMRRDGSYDAIIKRFDITLLEND